MNCAVGSSFPHHMAQPVAHSSDTAAGAGADHDGHVAQKALMLLSDGSPLDELAGAFTPEAASRVLLLTRPRPPLFLAFLRWASARPFFSASLRPQSLALHLLLSPGLRYSRGGGLRSAFALARRLAVRFPVPVLIASLAAALPVISPAPRNPSSAFDLLVKCYASLSLLPQALDALTRSKEAGFCPSALSYNSVLDGMFRSPAAHHIGEKVEQFLANMSSSGILPNIYTYNILIRGFCSRGELGRALSLLTEMSHAGCSPNVVSYNTLVDGHCKTGKIDTAFGLLRTMDKSGVRPNLVTYNTIINGLCRAGRTQETGKLMDEMQREGLIPNAITYNTLVNGYCGEGDLHQALILHADMTCKGVAPDVFTYTSLINAMCKAGNLGRAMELVNQMKERGLRPNDVTFTTLIYGFCKKGFLDDAVLIMEEMKASGIRPSIVCYNALINGYCMLDRMDEAMKILRDKMKGKDLAPDVVTYSTILSGYCRSGDLNMAFQLNEEMLAKGIKPDAITYSSLIRGLCEALRINDASELLEKMLKMDLHPDELTYTTLINGHCKEGNVKQAFLLHDEMTKKGILPDVVTYNVLINGLNKAARTKEAKRLLFRMYYDALIPESVTYDLLIDRCVNTESKNAIPLLKSFCMKGLMDEADRVFDSIISKPDSVAYSIIIHGHCRAGNVEKALSLYKEMLQAGFVPNAISMISLIKGLSDNGMDKDLNAVIQHLLEGCVLPDAETSKFLVEVNWKDGNMETALMVLTKMAKDGLLPNTV